MASIIRFFFDFLRTRFARVPLAANPRLFCEKALLLADSGQGVAALSELDALLRIPIGELPADVCVAALRTRIKILYVLRRFADARADFDVLLARMELIPEVRAEVLLDKCCVLFQDGDKPGAIALCENVFEMTDISKQLRHAAFRNLCFMKKDSGDIAGATRLLATFVHSTAPGLETGAEDWGLSMLKNFHLEAEDISGAIEALTEIIENLGFSDEFRAVAYFERGILRGRNNLLRAAILDFSVVLLFIEIPLKVKRDTLLCRADALQQLGDSSGAALNRALAFSITPAWRRLVTMLRYSFPALILFVIYLLRTLWGDS